MSYTGSILMHWAMNGESDLAGYRVYQGVASRTYAGYTDVGLTATTGAPVATISGIGNSVLTYLAVTAYDATGNESTFSAEVSTTKAVPLLSVLRQVR